MHPTASPPNKMKTQKCDAGMPLQPNYESENNRAETNGDVFCHRQNMGGYASVVNIV